ncbi:hypothetical protein AAIB78_002257 [Morganella morganii]
MFGLDNKSGINVMPPIAPADSQTPLWFTEGGAGLSATYPGQDWFNQIQAELLNVLKAADIAPQKGSLNQLSSAISKLASAYAISIVQATGQSLTSVMSQKSVTDEMNKKFDKTGGDINGGITASGAIKSQGRLSVENDNGFSGLDLIGGSYDVVIDTNGKGVPYVAIRDKASGNTYQIALPLKSGTAALLSDIAKNTADKSASGWWKCADTGVIFQWGVVTRTGRKTHVNYPIPFPSACRAVTATLCNNIDQATTSTANIRTTSVTRTGFDYESNDWQEGEASWISVGY